MEQIYTPTKDYKVLVRCFTYNQSRYIEDALNGFAMQKTDFPFVCLVMDDASTDGEQEVIKAWMERECNMPQAENIEIEKSFITLVPHKTNSNCTFVFYFLKENLYKKGEKISMVYPWREHCEYEALCEGDDYWEDKNKIQEQADYFDMNPRCGLSYTLSKIWNEKEKRIEGIVAGPYYGYEKMLIDNPIASLSTMYRINLLFQYYNEIKPEIHSWEMGDYPLWLYLGAISDIKFFNKITSVYRLNIGSASRPNDVVNKLSYINSRKDIQLFFSSKYGFLKLKPLILSQNDYAIVMAYKRYNRISRSINYIFLSENLSIGVKLKLLYKVLFR